MRLGIATDHGGFASKEELVAANRDRGKPEYELLDTGVFDQDRYFDVFVEYAPVGLEFEIQDVRFAGTEECRPCYWMNNAYRAEPVAAWFQGRGGLRARILFDGVLRREG